MSHAPAIKDASRKSRGRRRLGCVVLLLLIVLLGGLVVLVGRSRWRSEPPYWKRNQTVVAKTSQPTLTDIADRAFNRILGELSDSRGYKHTGSESNTQAFGVRTIRLDFDEANAWLATRLNDWLANQQRKLPPGLSKPMLASDDGVLIAAFRYQNQDIDQVFSVLLSLEFLDDGQAVLSIDGIYGGRLRLPATLILNRLPGHNGSADTRRSRITSVLLGERPFDPILPIDGTRQARIIGMHMDDKGVEVTVRAEPGRD